MAWGFSKSGIQRWRSYGAIRHSKSSAPHRDTSRLLVRFNFDELVPDVLLATIVLIWIFDIFLVMDCIGLIPAIFEKCLRIL